MIQEDTFLSLVSYQLPLPEELWNMQGNGEQGRSRKHAQDLNQTHRPRAHGPGPQPGCLCPLTVQTAQRTTPAMTGPRELV